MQITPLYANVGIWGGFYMDREEIISKLRGIKALLFMASSSTDQIEDQDQAFWLLAEQLAECIDALENDR